MKFLWKKITSLVFPVLLIGFSSLLNNVSGFNPDSKFREISPGIYLFQDICNVYVLKSGTSAILIDAGSGRIAEFLPNIGVNKVEWVLHTHYHRDQAIGSNKMKKSGARIAIGEKEAPILYARNAPYDFPEKILLNGELTGWGARFAPFQFPGVDKKLSNREFFQWNQYKIEILNTPGHTEGSQSFIIDVNGKKLCFSGDLLIEGGHIRDFYSMQWIYLQNPGIDSAVVSLERIKKLNPDLILPSHGGLISKPQTDIDIMLARLLKVNSALNYQRAGRWNWSQMTQVSRHIIQDGGSTTQIVISGTGDALLFDCGKEFSPERLAEAKAKFGIKRVDVIIPSHWHYDHIDGISAISKLEGSKVWAWEGLAEYLSNPERFPVTCWETNVIEVDRILKEDETFNWGGYAFKVFHHPLHTEQQMGLFVNADGLAFYMLADGLGYSRDGKLRSPLHGYNGISLNSGLIKSAHSFIQANPYICLPAHSNVFAVSPNDKYEYYSWAIETSDAIRALLSPPLQDLGFDPYWATFYPVRTKCIKGEQIRVDLRLKNCSMNEVRGQYKIKSYGNLFIEDVFVGYQLKPGETKIFPVNILVDKKAKKGIHIITADIEIDGQTYAEYPQGYIEIDE